jgi:hypothetical protein
MIEFDKTPYQVNFSVPYVNVAVLLFRKELLADIHKYSRIVIDATHDGWTINDVRTHLDILGYKNEAVILTNKFGQYTDDVVFFPYWFYRNSIRYGNQPLTNIGNRHNRVSCLNRNPTAFRLYLYYQLLQRKYGPEIMLSMHGLTCPYSQEQMTLDHPRFNDIPADAKQWLREHSLVREAYPGDNGNNFDEPGNPGDHNWLHPAFSDTYLNIITESGVSTGFYSEKTFKPLAAGQLFFMVADANSTRGLQRIGFETFDTDFDAHSYEHAPSFVTRIDNMVTMLDHKYDQIEDIYFSNLLAIQHNQEYILSDRFRQDLLAPLKQLDILAS